ncbi:hypothetical protein DMENIID0001_000930 [Sergentomyia squamirostris]
MINQDLIESFPWKAYRIAICDGYNNCDWENTVSFEEDLTLKGAIVGFQDLSTQVLSQCDLARDHCEAN